MKPGRIPWVLMILSNRVIPSRGLRALKIRPGDDGTLIRFSCKVMPIRVRLVSGIILPDTNLGTHAADRGIRADFHTSLDILCALLNQAEAPQAVANFIGIAGPGR